MIDSPLVSIVIPVYNVAPYLRACLDSVLRQTYTQLEIIVVDDGSTDECPAVCDEYAKKDARFRVVHQANGGLSHARNVGTSLVAGQYILFVDSDDIISDDLVEAMVTATLQCQADICLCRIQKSSRPHKPVARVFQGISGECLTSGEALKRVLYQRATDVSAISKMVRTEIAQNRVFPKGRIYEDLSVTYLWFLDARKVAILPACGYFYFMRQNSIVHSKFNQKSLDQLTATNEMFDYFTNENSEFLAAARARRYSSYAQMLLHIPLRDPSYAAEIGVIKATLKRDAKDVLHDRNCRLKTRAAALICALFPPQRLRLFGWFIRS